MSTTKSEVLDRDAPGEGRVLRAAPAVDVFENDDEVVILADLPGVAKDAVDIRIDARELTIQATRKTPQGDDIQYRRTFGIPSHLDPTTTAAELRDGVLHLRLPKRETAKPRKVEVRVA